MLALSEEKVCSFLCLNNIFQTNVMQLGILLVWYNANGCMELINCAISAPYTTFSAFVTLQTCHGVSISIQPRLLFHSSHSKVTWTSEQYLGEACASTVQRKNNDKHINNVTAQQAVQIREKTENNLLVAYKSVLCWWRRLCTQQTEEKRKHERMEGITRWEQEKRRENTSERWLSELMIKTVCVSVFWYFYKCENETWDYTSH